MNIADYDISWHAGSRIFSAICCCSRCSLPFLSENRATTGLGPEGSSSLKCFNAMCRFNSPLDSHWACWALAEPCGWMIRAGIWHGRNAAAQVLLNRTFAQPAGLCWLPIASKRQGLPKGSFHDVSWKGVYSQEVQSHVSSTNIRRALMSECSARHHSTYHIPTFEQDWFEAHVMLFVRGPPTYCYKVPVLLGACLRAGLTKRVDQNTWSWWKSWQ